MRGMDALLAMRMRGQVPPMVFIETDTDPNRWYADWPSVQDGCAHLFIDQTEAIRGLDLRCVVGLIVNVAGMDAERVEAVWVACVAAGAKRVIGAVFEPDFRDLKTVAISDTAGELTWPT